MSFQNAIHGGFRDCEPGMVGDLTGQFARTQIGLLERGFEDGSLLGGRQPVPHRSWLRLAVHQSHFALGSVPSLPTIERRTR